jgi:nucleotide-binding universal stress UspA family protein
MSFQKILVALDYSDLSQAVFAQALELAKTNESHLMLLHCLASEMISQPMVPIPTELGLYPEFMNPAYQEAQLTHVEKRVEQVRALLRSYCEAATSQGVRTTFDYKIGDAGQCLCQTARKWGAQLIVLGRRGRTGWTEALLGSVSNYVLHHAPCSVLIIQAGVPHAVNSPQAAVSEGINPTQSLG